MNILLEDGKYEYRYKDGVQCVFRNGEPWRDITGDKFIYCMAARIKTLEDALEYHQEQTRPIQKTIDVLHVCAKRKEN